MYIERLDDYGRGITYVDNKITFVYDALIGEEVEIKIVKNKKKYNEAIVTNYLKKSNNRCIPKCPYFNKCGGCNLLHMDYESQLKFKINKVNNILKKFGNIDFKITKIEKTNNYFYRNKITLHKLGYYSTNSNDVIKIDECLIADSKINKIIKEIKELENIEETIIRCSKNSSMLVFKTNSFIDVKDIDVDNIVVDKDNYLKVLKGEEYIKEQLGDLEFIISPNSFFQVNTEGALKLYNKVLEFSELKKDENVLDLFCGTGTIGIFLSRFCNSVIGIEINKLAVDDAIKNKKLNHIDNIDFICDDASNVNVQNIDVVVVDPPRSGLNKKIINYLINIKAKKIVYVSCDPITLARDLKELNNFYDIKNIELVDMFPNTYHVECVCVLNLK